MAIENVLRDAKVSGLLAVLFPTLFKYLHPRFERGRRTFESCRSLMKEAISRHKGNEECEDFIDAYSREIEGTRDEESSFYKERQYKNISQC